MMLECGFKSDFLYKKFKNKYHCHVEILANTVIEIQALTMLLDAIPPTSGFHKFSVISYGVEKNEMICKILEYFRHTKLPSTCVAIIIDDPLPCLSNFASAYGILLINRKSSLESLTSAIKNGGSIANVKPKFRTLNYPEFITLKTFLQTGSFITAKTHLNCSLKNLYRYRRQALEKLGLKSLNTLLIEEKWLYKIITQQHYSFFRTLIFPNATL